MTIHKIQTLCEERSGMLNKTARGQAFALQLSEETLLTPKLA